jgi:hypothetical protein
MTYKESATAMFSADYKERFKAEYAQLLERRDKLFTMLEKWDRGVLDFTPTCPRWVLENQRAYMDAYLEALELRAELEHVPLKP